jgi:general secretion pathway protein E
MAGLLGTVPPIGEYFSPVKIVVMLVVVTLWFCVAPLVHKDVRKVRGPQAVWSGAVLGVGSLSLLIWLLSPSFAVGLMIFLVLTAAVLTAYVVYRNGRVNEESRILTADHIRSLMKGSHRRQVRLMTKLKVYTHDGKIVTPPNEETGDPEECEAYNLAQDLLYDLVWRRASEAELAPATGETHVRYVIDGVLNERPMMSLAHSEAIIQYLKPLAGMNPEDRRRPQNGSITVDLAGSPMEINLFNTGTTGGQRMQFRVVQEFVQTHLAELGMSADVLAKVRAMNQSGNGILLVSGMPRSGITSTLYSLLREHDSFIRQLVTLEARPQIDLENITQNAYGEATNLPNALGSAMRRDPDVILVDLCEDRKTAQMIVESAPAKMFLVGMHATESFGALAKWIKLGGNTAGAIANLRGVLCQILVRKLCPSCKESYRPDPQLLAKANLSGQNIEFFYRPPSHSGVDEKGRAVAVCHTCQGSGYFGRTAVFELLEVDDELRQLVMRGATLSQLKAACRKKDMLYLQEQAVRMVIQGVTGIQEVIRVSQQEKV